MKLLLISHGNFCHGIKESYEMIAGKNDNIISICLGDDGIGVFSEKLRSKLTELVENDEVLVLSDIQGGTPYNEAYRFKLENPDKVEILAGMNLPMLIECGTSLDISSSIEELVNIGLNVGKDSIVKCEIDDSDDDDDDLEF